MAQLRMFDGSTDRGGATGTSCASEAEGVPKFLGGGNSWGNQWNSW